MSLKIDREKLKVLCCRYVWYVLVMKDLDNFDYTSNMKRAELHQQIADMLGCDTHTGYLKWALNDLEDSAGLPEELPACEEWEALSKKCASQLCKNLVRIYVPSSPEQ